MTWCTRFGKQHDSYNAVKAGAKSVDFGRVWRDVTKFAAVNNLPYGPYRSGSWGIQLQEVHAEVVQELSPDHPELLTAAHEQSEIDYMRLGGPGDLQCWWTAFGTLQYCVKSQTVSKFSRWQSIEDCWIGLRDRFFFY